ncbi:MAG: hypothetical protein ACTIBA_00900, partial [Lactobacillus delbrueckii]
ATQTQLKLKHIGVNMKQKLTKQEQQVLACLPKGEKNAKKVKLIILQSGCNKRDLYETRESLLKKGVPIGSLRHPPYGWFIPANKEEAKRGLLEYSSQAATMNKTVARFKAAIQEEFG